MQEAILLVLRSVRRRRRLPYQNQGVQAFGNWLWLLWYRECRRAAERLAMALSATTNAWDSDEDARLIDKKNSPLVLDRRRMWERVLFIISRLDDPDLRLVMSDWASGMSGLDTVRTRDISDWRVYRLRKQGLQLLKRELESDQV